MDQLPLAIRRQDALTFASFRASDRTRLALASLGRPVETGGYALRYLHGPGGCGKSHLLQGLYHAAAEAGEHGLYLPLAALAEHPPQEVFSGLESRRVICLDELDAVAGRRSWELALFNLINARMQCGGLIVAAARRPPDLCGFALPDLVSRLQQGLVLGLAEPSDAEKRALFIWHGHQRGMLISEHVAEFVMTHAGRDLHALMRLLDDMDALSLRQQRRITIPFVRQLLQPPREAAS